MQEYGGYGGYGGYGYPPPPEPPRRPGVWRYIAVAVAAGALGAGTVLAVGHSTSGSPVADQAPAPAASGSAPQTLPNQGNGGLGGGGLGGNGNGDGNGEGNGNGNFGGGLGSGGLGGSGLGGSGSQLSSADQAIYNKVKPGLVIIKDSLNYQAEAAAGTGMVISSSGLVLTNNHVIENATSISATVLATGKTYKVKVLGYDETGDVAAVQLENASGLRTIPLGDSSTVKSGDSVLAMGNAEGESEIVPAAGKVTGINQTITASDDNGTDASETLHGMLKTDADIVSGDSGGALASSSGQVIGMNTAGDGVSYGDQQATGFAIPINTALSIVDKITAGQGSSTISLGYPPFIGVFTYGTSSSPAAQLQQAEQEMNGESGFGGGGGQQTCYDSNADMPVPTSAAQVKSGTLIIGSICNTPAATAGMRGGDVITAVNGKAVGSPNGLLADLSSYKPGDSVTITWVNLSGHSTTSKITLAAGPPR
jgi:S1-C subfamily serine protease